MLASSSIDACGRSDPVAPGAAFRLIDQTAALGGHSSRPSSRLETTLAAMARADAVPKRAAIAHAGWDGRLTISAFRPPRRRI